MSRFLTFFGAGLAAIAVASMGLAAPTATQLAGWVKQLDDESYARREEACQHLLAAGESAIEVLAEGVLSKSPEAAWRAGETLKQIAVTGSEQQLDHVAAALTRLEKQGRPGMGKVVAEIRLRQKQLRHDRAAAQIRNLGGALAGGSGGGMGDIGFAFGMGAVPMIALDAVEIAEPVPEADVIPVPEEKLAPAALAKVRDGLKELFEEAVPAAEPAPFEGPAPLAPRPVIILGEAVPAPVPPAIDEPEAPRAAPAIEAFGVADFIVDVLGEEEEIVEVAEVLTLDANWRGGDEGLRAVRDLPDITNIEIRGAQLTDLALAHLATLPKLERLQLQGTKFSHKALAEFRRARPETTVFCQGEAMLGIHADMTGSCVITSVYHGSGAFEAGLKDGDQIVAVDGIATNDFSDLTMAVYPHAPGDKITVEFERGGERKKVEVTLKARKALEKRSE